MLRVEKSAMFGSQTEPIYLDGFASLPLAEEARAAMLDAWRYPGNAGSANYSGERSARIVSEARNRVAALIGAAAPEIIFTSGATEANNNAVFGLARTSLSKGDRRRIIVSTIEHKAVLEPALALSKEGFEITLAPVDAYGRLDLSAFAELLDERVLLVSVMLVNNETGVIQPVKEVAAMAHQFGAFVHSDASQAVGKIPVDVIDLDIDYLSLSAHKCYGPMGIGALYMAAGTPKLMPLLHGGGQQSGVRPGTEPVPLIAGFGAAAQAAVEHFERNSSELAAQKVCRLLDSLASEQVRFRQITGDHEVVPGSAAIAFEGIDGDSLCALVAREVSLSTGSACNSGQLKVSHVLEAMGLSETVARSVIRIFCDRTLTDSNVDRAAEAIVRSIRRSHLATGEVRQ